MIHANAALHRFGAARGFGLPRPAPAKGRSRAKLPYPSAALAIYRVVSMQKIKACIALEKRSK